jgi:O-antigen ligase
MKHTFNLDKAIFSLLVLSLSSGVLLYGAVHTYVYTFTFLCIFAAALWWIPAAIAENRTDGHDRASDAKTGLAPLFIALFGYFLLQIVPLPPRLLETLSPEAAVIHRMAVPAPAAFAANPSPEHWLPLATYVYPVRQSLIRLCAYWFFVSQFARVLDSRRRINTAVSVFLALAAGITVYGIAQAFSDHPHIWWFIKQFYRHDVTATYINRNHYAGFMAMSLPLAAGFTAALWRPGSAPAGTAVAIRHRISGYFLRLSTDPMMGKRMLVLFAGVIMGIGLILSASRGGIISAAGAMLMLTLLYRGKKGHREKGAVLFVLLAVITLYVWNIGIDYPLQRFDQFWDSYESRLRYARHAMAMAADYRWFGTGIGTFMHAYPQYQSAADVRLFLSHAHNDYVQYLAEAGILGTLLLGAGVVFYVYRVLRLWSRRTETYAVCIGIVPLAALTAVGIHSYSDFNLHIPANVLVLGAVAAIGAGALNLQRREKIGEKLVTYPPPRSEYVSRVAAVLSAGLILWCGYWSVRHFMAEVYCNTVPNSTLNRNSNPSPENIRKAIGWDHANAAYRYKLYLALAAQRDRALRSEWQRERQFQIIEAVEAAIRLNPLMAQYHLRAGWEYTFLWQEPDYHQKWLPAADLAMERAAYLAGESRPELHRELGNYWAMRSKSLGSDSAAWESAWARACWHYKKAQSVETKLLLKRLKSRIRDYVWNYYPDRWFLDQVLLEGEVDKKAQQIQ